MIFSLFDPSLRMASIEVLDYRKDGEVEARPVTGVNITGRWPISFIGAAEVRSPRALAFGRRRRESADSRSLGRADPPPPSV